MVFQTEGYFCRAVDGKKLAAGILEHRRCQPSHLADGKFPCIPALYTAEAFQLPFIKLGDKVVDTAQQR